MFFSPQIYVNCRCFFKTVIILEQRINICLDGWSDHYKQTKDLNSNFSLNRPTALIQSLSCIVRLCVICPATACNFVEGLLLSASLPGNGGFKFGT